MAVGPDDYSLGPQRQTRSVDPQTGRLVDVMEIPVSVRGGHSITVQVPLAAYPGAAQRMIEQRVEQILHVSNLGAQPS